MTNLLSIISNWFANHNVKIEITCRPTMILNNLDTIFKKLGFIKNFLRETHNDFAIDIILIRNHFV